MNKIIIFVIVVFISVLSNAQNKETYTIETSGASVSQQDELQNEFYGQYRGVFIKRTLSPSISILAGLNQSRIDSKDFLEFPLLFQYQFSPKLKLLGGAQYEIIRNRETGRFIEKEVSFSIDATYQFTENWDASIQFIQPFIQKKGLDKSSSFLPSPIRLRTGFKF